jgi:cytochrome b subunit of formate dehydrogenase
MDNKTKYIFDDPKNVKRVMHFLYASCVLLFGLDFVIDRHVYHSWENLWGFHAFYGFVGCVVLVIVATWMRTFLMRPEDYYDDEWKADIGVGVDEKHKSKAGVFNVDD